MKGLKSAASLQLLQIAKINLQHNFIMHILVGALVLFLTPVLFGITDLDRFASAVPLERFVALLGPILLTPIFGPEQSSEIDDVVSAKYIGRSVVCAVRIFCLTGIMAVMILVFAIYMRESGCEIPPVLVTGTIADAVFLGSLGMLAGAISGNVAVAYMLPVMYYTLCMGMGNKLGSFYLFAMEEGNYAGKPRMLIIGILLAAVSVWIREMKKR
ncbi:MAG: hypothetical protein HFG96_05780 [Lachnospiraceae bacterium]|nr:hypothetical protein [Lachnospiraceae bacterium]